MRRIALSPGLRDAFRYLVILCLLVPIRLGEVQGVELSLAFVAVGLSLPFLALLDKTWGAGHLLLSIAASAAALLGGLVVADAVSLRPLISFTYFWLAAPLFPLGGLLITSEAELARTVRWAAVISATVGILVALGLLAAGSPVRIEGTLMGSILGLPLYATFGVNSLATIYAMHWCYILVDMVFGERLSPGALLFRLAGLSALSYLLVFSLSRGSVAACLAFALMALALTLRYRRRVGIAMLVGLVVVGGVATIQFGELLRFAWAAKLENFSSAEQATAGRTTLYLAALADLRDRPLVGSAFQGFLGHPGVVRVIGSELFSSPHNQYLMILWKTGLVAGSIYLAFLLRAMRASGLGLRENLGGIRSGLFFMFTALMLTSLLVWDALLVPNVGGLFLFFLGGMIAAARIGAPGRLRTAL